MITHTYLSIHRRRCVIAIIRTRTICYPARRRAFVSNPFGTTCQCFAASLWRVVRGINITRTKCTLARASRRRLLRANPARIRRSRCRLCCAHRTLQLFARYYPRRTTSPLERDRRAPHDTAMSMP